MVKLLIVFVLPLLLLEIGQKIAPSQNFGSGLSSKLHLPVGIKHKIWMEGFICLLNHENLELYT